MIMTIILIMIMISGLDIASNIVEDLIIFSISISEMIMMMTMMLLLMMKMTKMATTWSIFKL